MTLTEVRNNLNKIAMLKNRPPYEMCVVKAVRDAFESGAEHQLKTEIIRFLRTQMEMELLNDELFELEFDPSLKHTFVSKDCLESLLDWISKVHGRQQQLCNVANVSPSLISLARNTRKCTLSLYKRLMKGKEIMVLKELVA